MKIKLNSNFIDFYDHLFCSSASEPDKQFNRWAQTNFSKSEQLNFMKEKFQLNVPDFIPVKQAATLPQYKNKMVVVHVDEYCHRSEGKEFLSISEALEKYPEKNCILYFQSTKVDRPLSIRYLIVGGILAILEYESSDKFCSNKGDVQITIKQVTNSPSGFDSPFPIFAIDFLEIVHGNMLAIDFNVSPQIKGTGLERYINAESIYKQVEMWYKVNNDVGQDNKIFTERYRNDTSSEKE